MVNMSWECLLLLHKETLLGSRSSLCWPFKCKTGVSNSTLKLVMRGRKMPLGPVTSTLRIQVLDDTRARQKAVLPRCSLV